MSAPGSRPGDTAGKVPAVTIGFWVLKILATTLGEAGGDAVSMSMGLGYLAATAVFAALFLVMVWAQVRARRFHATLYWLTIIATTTVGTTLADFADRSLGIGYAGGSALLLALLTGSLIVWRRVAGSVALADITDRRAETFYWVTIMCSQTLGTALGDWTADTAGIGYGGGTVLFGGLLLVVLALYRWSRVSHTTLFWCAFVLTRPLGAVLGDLLDKPVEHGGLALSRYTVSLVLLAAMAIGVRVFPQRAAAIRH